MGDKSTDSYQLLRPVVTDFALTGYTEIFGPDGGQADVRFPSGTLGFLAAYVPYTTQSFQWPVGGGVHLIKSQSSSGNGNALCLRDLDGPFTWPGPGPNCWSGPTTIKLNADFALTTWGTNNVFIDLMGTFDGQTPGPITLITTLGSLILGLTGTAGYEQHTATTATLADNSRHQVEIGINNVARTWYVKLDTVTVGSGSFSGPLAEPHAGYFCVGGQMLRIHTDPDMTLYGLSITVDGGTPTALTIPTSPDFYFPPTFLLSDPLKTIAARPACSFRRLRIWNAAVDIAFGCIESPVNQVLDDLELSATNVPLAFGIDYTSAYPISSNRVTFDSCNVAPIRSYGALGVFRDPVFLSPLRTVLINTASNLTIEVPTLAPGPAMRSLVSAVSLSGAGCRTVFTGGPFDFEGAGPSVAYVEGRVGSSTSPGLMLIVLDTCDLGNGTTLANLTADPGVAAGTGCFRVRDCTFVGTPPPVTATAAWQVAIGFNQASDTSSNTGIPAIRGTISAATSATHFSALLSPNASGNPADYANHVLVGWYPGTIAGQRGKVLSVSLSGTSGAYTAAIVMDTTVTPALTSTPNVAGTPDTIVIL